jgi:predicted alpha/beta hydrolase
VQEPEYAVTADGWPLALRHFAPAVEDGKVSSILVILPAMGAHSGIYARLAAHLAAQGHPVIAADPRGMGASGPAPKRGIDYGVTEHIEWDIPAILDWARDRYPGRPIVLGGHSLGGHLGAMFAAANPGQVQGLFLLTVSHVHYKNFSPLSLLLFGGFSAAARTLGYLPGHRIGWGSPIARGVVLDWAGWALTGRWRDSRGTDFGPLFGYVDLPMLSISFSDDTILSPKHAADRFTEFFPAAKLERWHFSPDDLAIDKAGHFDHLRGCPVLWDRIGDWLRNTMEQQPAAGSATGR